MANDVPDTTKAEVAVILKKAAPILGIDGSAYHVMDILLGLSRASDWRGSNRPIVAISNAKLAEYIARSERQVTRCIRRLVEAGIVAYRDSPTGRRFVYRAKDGAIDKGYGLDFTPARVRVNELKELVEAFQARLNADQERKRATTRFARAIADACNAYPENAARWRLQLEAAGESAEDLEALHTQIVMEVTSAPENDKMSGEGDTSVTPNINTTPQNSFARIPNRPRSNERETFAQNHGRDAAVASTEKKSDEGGLPDASSPGTATRGPRTSDTVQSEVLASVSVGLVRAACPQASEFAGSAFRTWPELARSADTMRVAVGLSETAWLEGVKKVGRYASAAILATVLQKALTVPDQITSPGGYFRAMVDRALDGSLRLEKSLFGLADSALRRGRDSGG